MGVRPEVVERIVKTINFEHPDRAAIWEMLQNRAVFEHFAPGVPFPQCGAIAHEKLGIDATYGCYQVAEEVQANDDQQVSGQTVWDLEPRFRTLDDLRAWRPHKIDERLLEERMLQQHHDQQELFGPSTMYLPQNGGWTFLPGYDATTFTVMAMAMMDDPAAMERFWDAHMAEAITRNSITARHKLAPIIQCCDDVAYKTGLIVSPEILREHFFPRFAQIIAPLKEAGIKVIWHSDGNIMDVLDDAVAIGFDGIDPIESQAGMDIAAIRRKYPKLILVGNVDGNVLAFGTPEEVRADVRRCIRGGAADGGGHLLQCGAGQVMPDAKLENVIAYFDEVHTFGQYPLDPE